MQQHRSKMLAFLLNMIPGLGHYYYGSRLKGFIYGFIFLAAWALPFLHSSQGIMRASPPCVF